MWLQYIPEVSLWIKASFMHIYHIPLISLFGWRPELSYSSANANMSLAVYLFQWGRDSNNNEIVYRWVLVEISAFGLFIILDRF